jgi:hypothetical protein
MFLGSAVAKNFHPRDSSTKLNQGIKSNLKRTKIIFNCQSIRKTIKIKVNKLNARPILKDLKINLK